MTTLETLTIAAWRAHSITLNKGIHGTSSIETTSAAATPTLFKKLPKYSQEAFAASTRAVLEALRDTSAPEWNMKAWIDPILTEAPPEPEAAPTVTSAVPFGNGKV